MIKKLLKIVLSIFIKSLKTTTDEVLTELEKEVNNVKKEEKK